MASALNSIDVEEALQWLSAIGVREPSSTASLMWVWKLLLIKVSKKGMKRRRNWAARAALSLLCMVAAPAEVFCQWQGLEEVAGDVTSIARGQGQNHSLLTGFKAQGNYTQVAKWIDVSACQQFLEQNRRGLWERERRAEPHLMSNA